MFKWYVEVLKKYATFRGRARREEFWMFLVTTIPITFGLTFLDDAMGLTVLSLTGSKIFPIASAYHVLTILPALAVTVRRYHDTNKSGWLMAVLLIPFLGLFIHIRFLVQPGDTGPNAYGDDPKARPAAPPAGGGTRDESGGSGPGS